MFRRRRIRQMQGACGETAPPPPTGIADTFTGADATDLQGRALSSGGGTWEVLRGGWDLQGNAARCHDLSGAGGNVMVTDAGAADGTMEVALYFAGRQWDFMNGGTIPTGYAGIYVRADSGDGSGIEFYLNGNGQKVESFTNDGSNGRSPLGETPLEIVPQTTYAVKAVLLGTSVKLYVDDVLKLDLTTAFNQAETRHGLWTWNVGSDFTMPPNDTYGDDQHRWDEFTVTL